MRDSNKTMTRNSNYARRQRKITTSYPDRVERESVLLQRISTLSAKEMEVELALGKYLLFYYYTISFFLFSPNLAQ